MNRKGERMARRELLYTVVRESMMRSGVLSASYKFKVLSLDARGRQFLVMVDLAREQGGETSRLAEIEALIAQGAKSRYDIVVTSVYWRMNEHVAIGAPNAQLPRGTHSQPAPQDSRPATLDSAPQPLEPEPAAPAKRSRFEPIQADEVAAFKKALASGATKAARRPLKEEPPHDKHGPHSYAMLTGFEDTEMPDSDKRSTALSTSQYGELR